MNLHFRNLHNFLTIFLVTTVIFSCNTDSINTTPQKVSENKLEKPSTKGSFSIKGIEHKQAKISKKNKEVEIGLETVFDKTPYQMPENSNKNTKFNVKSISDTIYYPKEIGTTIDFEVDALPDQNWIIFIQGPQQTVCNIIFTQRVWSTGSVWFTLYLPENVPLTGDYNV